MTDAVTDAELATAVRDGSREALGLAYTKYRRMALKVLSQRSIPEDLFDDMVQEAFLLLEAELRRNYSGRRSLGAHVARATLRALNDHRQHSATGGEYEKRRAAGELAESVADADLGPAEAAEIRERFALLRELLERLPAGLRRILWAREVEGLTAEEVSERFGMPKHSVGTMNARAHRRLLELAQDGPLDEVLSGTFRPIKPIGAQRVAVRALLADGEWHFQDELRRAAGRHRFDEMLLGLNYECERAAGFKFRYRLARFGCATARPGVLCLHTVESH